MIENGYILLSRKLCNHWLWGNEEESFSRAQAWIDIIFSANFKDQKKNNRYGKPEVIKRGSFVTSIQLLATKWRWGKDKVRTFLKTLEEDEMIKVETSRKGTKITVINYSQYQQSKRLRSDVRTHSRYADPTTDPPSDPEVLNKVIQDNTGKEINRSEYNPFSTVGGKDGDI